MMLLNVGYLKQYAFCCYWLYTRPMEVWKLLLYKIIHKAWSSFVCVCFLGGEISVGIILVFLCEFLQSKGKGKVQWM